VMQRIHYTLRAGAADQSSVIFVVAGAARL
jgi:hypothetical protein